MVPIPHQVTYSWHIGSAACALEAAVQYRTVSSSYKDTALPYLDDLDARSLVYAHPDEQWITWIHGSWGTDSPHFCHTSLSNTRLANLEEANKSSKTSFVQTNC